MAPKQTICEKR